ncbi:MAG: AMP-binding protein, partial [Sulfobacillus sp.]
MRKWVIHEILADAALSHASVPVISGSQRFTYASLYDRSLRLANSLSRQGIGKGTVVGVMDVNSHRYLELKYALSMLGAVIHTINFRLPWDDLVFTVKHARDQWLFVWEGFGELASRIAQEVPQVVWMGSDRGAGYED